MGQVCKFCAKNATAANQRRRTKYAARRARNVMENKSLEYVTLHHVLQIMAPVFARVAVMYDPVEKRLTEHTVEIIGLVACGEAEEELITPCYMCSNSLGMFWVPDLEPTFISYLKPGETVDTEGLSD